MGRGMNLLGMNLLNQPVLQALRAEAASGQGLTGIRCTFSAVHCSAQLHWGTVGHGHVGLTRFLDNVIRGFV